MVSEETLSEMLRLADAAFREFAEMTAANDGKTFAEAQKITWQLYELGHLKLVSKGGRLRVQVCITGEARRAAAKQNQPLAAYRRRITRWSRRERERRPRTEPLAGHQDKQRHN
jgi:hypothetical protein